MRYHEIINENYHQYPARLDDNQAIAEYIDDLSSAYVDVRMIEDAYINCHADLRLVPMSELREGNPDANIRNKAKEKRYAKLDPATIPPLVVENGEVMDGNHRYRIGVAAGLPAMWCYVVEED